MSGPDSPRITALKRQWEVNRKAQKKVRVVNGKVEIYETIPAADLETILAAATVAEKAMALATAQVGQKIEGHGVFIGTWEPKDNDGRSLGKIFNMFAAPEDLTDSFGKPQTFKYTEALERIASLKNWHGYDGTSYKRDTELLEALKEGTYTGGWFIPPRELMIGKDAQENMVQPDNLQAHHDKGALRGTFTLATSTRSGCAIWYWTSTARADKRVCFSNIHFANGHEDWNHKDSFELSCRPVRLELKL